LFVFPAEYGFRVQPGFLAMFRKLTPSRRRSGEVLFFAERLKRLRERCEQWTDSAKKIFKR